MDGANLTQRADARRLIMFLKQRLKLNRFLLVIDTKRGVFISAITVIVVDLIDLLWNLSMTFGPLNSTMTSLLLVETLLVIFVSTILLFAIKSDNKADLRSILLMWLVVIAIDYALRTTIILTSLLISEKASTTAKVMKSVVSTVMLVLVAHCWLCVYTYYDDNNGKMTTVRITPSDDRGRSQVGKRPMMMMIKPSAVQDGQQGYQSRGETPGASSMSMTNMLRAPTEDASKSRW